MSAMGKRIANTRKRKGLTQTELAQRAGIPQATISRIEAGKILKPSAEHVGKICGALSIDAGFLISGEARVQNGPQLSRWNVTNIKDVCERLHSVFDVSDLGMTVVDLNGRHYYTNRNLDKIMGYKAGELIGKTVHDSTHPEDLHISADFISQALNGEITSSRFRKRHFRKDGSIVSVIVTTSIIRARDGKPICFISQVEEMPELLSEDGIMGEAVGGE